MLRLIGPASFILMFCATSYAMNIIGVNRFKEELASEIKRYTTFIESTIDNGDTRTYTQSLGTLITPHWILTCCHGAEFHKSGFITIGQQKVPVEAIYLHPNYKLSQKKYDFALIKLKHEALVEITHKGIAVFSLRSDNWCNGYTVAGVELGEFEKFSEVYGCTRAFEKKTGEVYKLLNVYGIKEVDNTIQESGMSDMLLTTHSQTQELLFSNFIGRNGISGGGLFDLNGHLIGVNAAYMKFDFQNHRLEEVEMHTNFFSIITDEIRDWINFVLTTA